MSTDRRPLDDRPTGPVVVVDETPVVVLDGGGCGVVVEADRTVDDVTLIAVVVVTLGEMVVVTLGCVVVVASGLVVVVTGEVVTGTLVVVVVAVPCGLVVVVPASPEDEVVVVVGAPVAGDCTPASTAVTTKSAIAPRVAPARARRRQLK